MTAILPQKSSATVDPATLSGESPRPFRRRLMMGLVALAAALLVFAPVFVAKTPLRQRILPMLLPEYPAKITTGRSSLLWWAKVELADVQFEDTAGQPLLHIDKITSEKSLIALLADQVRVGGFHIHRPHLTVRVQSTGSNLEDSIAPLFASEEAQGLDCALHVREGVVEIVDGKTGRKTGLENFEADIRLPLDPAEAIAVRGAAEVRNEGANGKAGTIDFDLTYRAMMDETNQTVSESGTLRLKTSDLKLEALSALFGRVGNDIELTGVVVSDLAAEWTLDKSSLAFKLHGGLNATTISLQAPDWLGQDKFQLEYLTHKGRVEYHTGEVHLTDVDLKSDVLTCQANGVLNVPQILTAWNTSSADIPLEDFHLAGEINLARIAKMLPKTLRLRNGLQIQTGQMLIALDAKTQNAEQHLSGKINTSQIAAVADGREIVWDKPLELHLKAHGTSAGPVLDELSCRADFLSLWAQGTPDNATIKAACKLDALMTELNRFADLENWKLAGRIDAGLTLRRLSPELLRGAASAIIKDFEFRNLSERSLQPWLETQLVLAAGGDLVSEPDQPRQLQGLSVRITSDGDELELTQTAPVRWTGEWPAVALVAQLRGNLRTWQNRLRPLVSTERWQMEGSIIATAKADLSQSRMMLEQVIADIQGLKFQAPGMNLSESRVHVETKAEWTAETNKLRMPATTWASPSLSLRADDVEYFTTPEGLPRTSGRAVFRGGVAELSRWLTLDKTLGPHRKLAGTASGQIHLTMTNQAADATWNLIVEDGSLSNIIAIEPPPGAGFRPRTSSRSVKSDIVWSEDRIAFRGGGVYHFGQDHLELRPTLLEAPWLDMTASGTLEEVTTKGQANLAGTLTFNLPLLAERFRGTLGETFEIAGNESRPFSLRGPLWGAEADQRVANELAAFASVPWKSIQAHGIGLGPAELRADLNLGTLQFGPLDATLGTGRLKFKSQLALNAPDLALQLEKGPILQNIRLTPEVSREWIKYAVPLLADSTETEGQFSVSLTTDGIIPLNNPAAMNASGLLEIESAQMRPGPLADAFLDLVKQVKTLVRGEAAGGVLPADQALIRLDKQAVNVQCANGRVYHQNLKLVLTDIPIKTSGSVGLDETLSLTAEIPIQADWLNDNRLLAGLKGQTLKIPVSGTLSQPILDTRAVFTALRKATQNATGRILEEELQDQLDRLFKRK